MKRYLFIDILKAIVVIVMIEVHVTNSILDQSSVNRVFFSFINFINGMVAPAFLFAAGMTFQLSLGKTISFSDSIRNFLKKIKSIYILLLIGYSLHSPFHNLRELIYTDNIEYLLRFSNVDILQCIAAGICILLFLNILFKNVNHKSICLVIFLILFTFSSTFIYSIDFTATLNLLIAAYLNEATGSYFPIFPWLGFLFAGALTGIWLKNSDTDHFEPGKIIKLTAISFFTGLLLLIILELLKSEYTLNLRSNPIFFFSRLSFIVSMTSICFYLQNKFSNRNNILIIAGQESLLIYWLHIQILYRNIFNGKSLNDHFSGSLNLPESMCIYAGILFFVILVSKLWNVYRTSFPVIYKYISNLFFLFISVYFITG